MIHAHSHDAYDGSVASENEPSWNFVVPDSSGSTALTEDPELERYLVEEIARAKRRRPLMKRLAHVEAAYAARPGGLGEDPETPHTQPEPPPLPPLAALDPMGPVAHGPPPAHADAPIDQLMEEFGETFTTPPASAAWLGKAKRERRRARARIFFAWSATLAIGVAIIAFTLQALQP